MNPPVEAVTFDAAGTLFEVAEPVGITYSRIARNHGLQADPVTLELCFRTVWNQIPPPHSNRDIDTGDADGHEIERLWWKSLVGEVFQSGCGYELENFDAIFSDLFLFYADPAAWRLLPDVPGVLASIQGRAKLAVISNFDRRFHAIARGLGIEEYFDSIVLSSGIAASKPDPAIFTAAARELGIDPARILHVGDDPDRDWKGARDSGFQVFEMDPKTNPITKIPMKFLPAK